MLPPIAHDMPLPFNLELGEHGLLECRQALRILPGRRLVCRARWRGEEVVAKLFSGERAERDWQREQQGSVALLTHGIPAPALLLSQRLGTPGTYIIVYRLVEDGTDGSVAYAQADDAQRARLRGQLVECLAQLHNAGLQHTDLHLDNFMFSADRLFVLDAASVRVTTPSLGIAQGEADLAVLLAQFNDLQDDQLGGLYTAYLSARDGAADAGDSTRFARELDLARAYRERKYLQKVFRECSAFAVERSARRHCVLARAFDSDCLRALLADPDRCMVMNDAAMLKDGNTSTVVGVEACGLSLVIKRYNVKHLWHWLRRALRQTRAANSWRNAHWLQMLGVATATPIAFIEERRGPLRGRSYFLMQSVDGTRADAYFSDARIPNELKQAQAKLLLKQFDRLANAGLVHGDYKATNFVIGEHGPLLLDLDALYRPGTAAAFRDGLRRDLRRFLRNWQDQPSVLALFRPGVEALAARHDIELAD